MSKLVTSGSVRRSTSLPESRISPSTDTSPRMSKSLRSAHPTNAPAPMDRGIFPYLVKDSRSVQSLKASFPMDFTLSVSSTVRTDEPSKHPSFTEGESMIISKPGREPVRSIVSASLITLKSVPMKVQSFSFWILETSSAEPRNSVSAPSLSGTEAANAAIPSRTRTTQTVVIVILFILSHLTAHLLCAKDSTAAVKERKDDDKIS